MARIVSVNHFILNPKEYNGQRVVTYNDIDLVHGRTEGTARRNFSANKERFIEGIDYYKISANEIRTDKIFDISNKAHQDVVLLTETGYLMLVKSFTDDLAWSVQRELVNHYFRNRVIQEKPNPKRREVVDIPINREFQKAFEEIRKSTIALDALMKGLNRYISQEDAEAYVKIIDSVGATILGLTDSIGRLKYGLMIEPY